jgi:hypothetical protein
MTFSRLVRGPLLMVSLVAAGGCSTFSRDFDAAVAGSNALEGGGGAAAAITGPWQGEWHSKHGHHGRLRAILSVSALSGLPSSPGGQKPHPPTEYVARFEAKFWGIFTAHYDVVLRVVSHSDPAVKLAGDQDLGWLAGGKYHYEATVTAGEFDATYDSRLDAGEFHLRRPAGQRA